MKPQPFLSLTMIGVGNLGWAAGLSQTHSWVVGQLPVSQQINQGLASLRWVTQVRQLAFASGGLSFRSRPARFLAVSHVPFVIIS